jgi:hypothetical protein
MYTRITGAGGLSSKILTVLVLSAMATMSHAADNSIYIDQAGDNSTITITQDGAGNKVKGILLNGTAGGTTDPAKLTGNAQTINIEQTGATNVLAVGVNSTQGGSVSGYANVGVNLNYQVSGGGNTGLININNNGQGTAIGNVVSVVQSGGGATTTLNMTGTSNQLTVGQSGGANNSFTGTINADNTVATVSNTLGGGNSTTLDMTGNKGQVSVTTTGATNTTSLTQSAFGTTGAQVLVNINGSGNDTTITQSGMYDHFASLTVVGSSNDFTIAQSGGSATGHSATMTVNGSSNVVGVTQQGTVSNLVNMAVSGGNNTYTILQKN